MRFRYCQKLKRIDALENLNILGFVGPREEQYHIIDNKTSSRDSLVRYKSPKNNKPTKDKVHNKTATLIQKQYDTILKYIKT